MRSAQFSFCCEEEPKKTLGTYDWFLFLAALPPHRGGIAQLVERLLCKQNVRSSSLLTSTNLVNL